MTPRYRLMLDIAEIARRHRVSPNAVLNSHERTADTVAARQEVCLLMSGRGISAGRIARFLGLSPPAVVAALRRARAAEPGRMAA